MRQRHLDRIEAGLAFDWQALPSCQQSADGVSPDTETLVFSSADSSFDGLSKLSRLRVLVAGGVDRPFLDEICAIQSLETLHLVPAGDVRDLSPLHRLDRLRHLRVANTRTITSLEWASGLKSLLSLGVENLTAVHDLAPLANLANLRALEIDGAIWTKMQIRSLSPLGALRGLEYLFLGNIQVDDDSLEPLHSLQALQVLEVPERFPMRQCARVCGALRKLREPPFVPYYFLERHMSGAHCVKCGNLQAKPTGRGLRLACVRCSAGRLKKHVDNWEAFAEAAVCVVSG